MRDNGNGQVAPASKIEKPQDHAVRTLFKDAGEALVVT